MDDPEIIQLYWDRDQRAIGETDRKYGAYCTAIIRRVLGDGRDAEECLNDTYLGAWNAMPPQRPSLLPPFLGRIARNTALDRYDYNGAARRGGFDTVLEELADCVSGSPVEEELELRRIGEAISAYLDTVSPTARRVFLRRYWYGDPVADIAARCGFTQGKVKSLLHRTRKGLRTYLIQEGYAL
jgi:RNA polymerase sigma-70 factor (ECF subfamily)